MKLCYFDESGTGEEPVAVVAGVVVDSQRMHLTKDHWAGLLGELSAVTGKPLSELHTKDFYSGSGPFRGMSGLQRAAYISAIVSWFCERKHDFVFSAIMNKHFKDDYDAQDIPAELETPWCAAAFHCILAIQRAHQKHEKTKGHTILFFDNKGHDEVPLTKLVLDPPAWSHEYYALANNVPPLSHIIDVPYFADSRHVPLLQVADFLAYFLRRYAEIAEGLVPSRYAEEEGKISGWVNNLSERCLGLQHLYPSKRRSDAVDFFYQYCPPSLRNLGS